MRTFAVAIVAAAAAIAAAALATQAQAAPSEAAWSAAIARIPAPGRGCFEADYPLAVWKQVACTVAPLRPYAPAGTVGAGADYAAETKRLTAQATGFFAAVKGLQWERGAGNQENSYSLQLNSNLMAGDPACAGAADPGACRGWQQFAYSAGFGVAFIQYWLIDYGAACPAGWAAFETSCFLNGPAVSAPPMTIAQIETTKLSGAAVKGGLDTLVLTAKRKAYSVTGDDGVLTLAKGWRGTEFNVFGDGGRAQATFNPGTTLTVEIDVVAGTRKAPTCQASGGTSGETNNLTLGACTAARGKTPRVTFTEGN
ncbi:MAG: hypothetical protein JOZ72_16485 [Alphaproteobacteria bacterium]|nr:hypothetical protein [Alphaproteobacteria bacterium]